MAVREHCFGDVTGLPEARALEAIDISHAFRARFRDDDPPVYGKVAPEVVDMPGEPNAMLRWNPHSYMTGDLDGLAQKAIKHFGLIERCGIRIPDLRFIIFDKDHLMQRSEALYTIVRRIGGQTLDAVKTNRAAHLHKMVEGMGSYYSREIKTPGSEGLLLDSYRTDNFTVTEPESSDSDIFFHDVEPWFAPIRDESGGLDRDTLINVLAIRYLSRNLRSQTPAALEAYRLVEGRGRRILRALIDPIINRREYEE